MKRKGFTLVELLGAIVILAIVLIIAVPTISSITNNQKSKAYNAQVSLILAKAQDWALKNVDNLAPDYGINFVDLSSLVSQGYVDNTSINDPRDGTNMNGCIVITYNTSTSQYDYSYSDLTCSEEEAKYGPEFSKSSSNGDSLANPETVEVGQIFSLPTITAKSKSSAANDLVVTGPEIHVINADGTVLNSIDVVDTSYVDRYYSLTYSAYDAAYKYTFQHTYYVKVVDTVGPVITMGTTKGTEKKDADKQTIYVLLDTAQTSYSVMTMNVYDNSCDPTFTEDAKKANNCANLKITSDKTTISLATAGTTDVKYSVSDMKNTTYYTLHYVVAQTSYTYTSGENDIIIQYPGTYKLEGYGAQGGTGSSAGGNGGYIAGTISLNVGDVVHVSVGAVGSGGAGATSTSGYANGGSSTIFSKSSVNLLIAAGGGAGGSTAGGAGGSGTGAGGSKPANCGAAGTAGSNGSGGGSSGSCTYSYHVYKSCTGSSCSTCCSSVGFNNTGDCSQNQPYTSCSTWSGGGCSASVCSTGTRDSCSSCCSSYTYDCGSSATATNYGTGGQGGTSSIGTGVTIFGTKADGSRAGNGLAVLSYYGN
jgi:prepilin-type N-terminal cleavage/methylation domain-containing protein